ncbi:hypothetical protein NDU88_009118 [Pleurodeles waltl]|uniref:Uncharacterized protein n=1 Tax=Pleurodeles waltl TaxID=8319 RepID=A0AAV7QWP9_PLEWA|nr:hypothetical protein NDU88_009118 [Pleurodeles waltl]
MVEAQLGMASQRGRGARRTMTLLKYRILTVAYPELDGRLRAPQQPQGGAILTVVIDGVSPALDTEGGRPAWAGCVTRAPWRPGSSLAVERWRIRLLEYSGRYCVLCLSVGGDRRAVCFYRRGGQSVKVAVYVGAFRHGGDSIFVSAGLLAVLPLP